MKIFDTLTCEEKSVIMDSKIRIYLCGVTVYDESHIGHARTIIVFDVLRRYLESKGITVEFIQNFTDVDDKIIDRAQKENALAMEISERYIQNYFQDFDALNVKRATRYPKATDHISDMQNLIQSLIDKDVAYVSKNGVYFSVEKFSEYGKLSKKNTEELVSGSRIEIDEFKKDPLDFALWKFSDKDPVWESPWGKGRPGWHIECSAMSIKYLGENFDIHGGGRDLIFPHHENEIAQSESHTKKSFAKIWMHVGMVTINGEKMSKSLGNIRTVKHALDNWGPNIIRIFCLSGHYSKPIDYSEDLLKESVTKWRQVETCYFEIIHAKVDSEHDEINQIIDACSKEFDEALENDFNTHLALSTFFKIVREINRLAASEKLSYGVAKKARTEFDRMMNILGLEIAEPTPEEINSINNLIKKREQLRKEKNFADADKIREQISGMNIELIDHKSGTIWMRKERIRSDS